MLKIVYGQVGIYMDKKCQKRTLFENFIHFNQPISPDFQNSTGRFGISGKNHRNRPKGKSRKKIPKRKYYFQKTLIYFWKF